MGNPENHEIHEQHIALAEKVVQVLTLEPKEPLPDLSGIYLFGSVARKEDTEQSDVDIVITHRGPEETSPLPFLRTVCRNLLDAQIPARASSLFWRSAAVYRVDVITASEELFQIPVPREPDSDDPLLEDTIAFWERVRTDAVQLYPGGGVATK